MTPVTQAEFARQIGVDRAYVTRLKQAGRLVMVGNKVDVDASRARIEETKDPNRDDVARRHAEAKAAKAAPEDSNSGQPDAIGSSYQAARAVKEKYQALNAKLEYERAAGDMVPKQDTNFVLDDFGATLRVRMENLAPRLAPVVFPLTTLEETHAAIAEEAEAVLADISEMMARRGEEFAAN